MDPGVVKEVYLAEVSSDVVELLIDLVQGLDRYLKLGNTPLLCQPILSAGSMWLVSQSSNSNQRLGVKCSSQPLPGGIGVARTESSPPEDCIKNLNFLCW